jgi:DNA-binding GntR family transcriptional regulator
VYEQLRERIMALDLAPGTVLPRAELALHFGVSQTPVREALIKLGEEGLVDIFPQHATVVSRIDIGAALQAHFLRRAIELELVHELAQLPPPRLKALVAELRRHLAQQKAAAAAGDYARFTAADHDFHHAQYAGRRHAAAVAADTPARRPCRPAATPEPAGQAARWPR